MSDSRFIHLHVHSDNSIADGLAKVECLIKQAKVFKMPALAITDFNNFYGLIKFYKFAFSVGIKPIIGVDFYLESEYSEDTITPLTILAKDNHGYHNLILLISQSYKQGYGKLGPTIKQEWLLTYREGLLILSGGLRGEVGRFLLSKNNLCLEKCLSFYQKYFFDNYYLEISRIGDLEEEKYIYEAVYLASKKNIPVVATNNVRFIDKDDFIAHEIRVAIYDGCTLSDPKRKKKYTSQQYFRSEKEMIDLFHDIPESLENTIEIAKRCNVNINFGNYFFPKFPIKNKKIEDFLISESEHGLEKRLNVLYPNEIERKKKRIKYDNRLRAELKIINQMKFSGYFLIVMEFIQWAKKHKIPVGPGRGSGAGSLVAYSLNITNLDPLKFDLLFERFLNPERISMPDFDIDFCMEKRDRVIEHVKKIYGNKSVSQIITFGTMTARAVIRDVGRVFGKSYGFVDRIAKLVPLDFGITLEKSLLIEPQLKKIYDSDEEIKILIDTAKKLEGVIRNASKHAGGVVIAPTKLTDFTPLYYDENGMNSLTQFDKNDIEEIGLVKFDLLGLRTLTIIDLTLNIINKNNSLLNIELIPLDDRKCFDLLKSGETTAIFQLESRGIKNLIKKLRPDCFEDIIALIALFRPGPLKSGMVDNFINRKHQIEKISYPDPTWQHKLLRPILESTYGIILYQEQVMKIAQVFAGYTLGQADVLCRSMSKKKPKEMKKQRYMFENGIVKNNINKKLGMKIFDLMEKFSGYGFNKSHATAYALLSYQTLWLKVYYPSEFMAAAMTSDMENTERVSILINESFRIGLKVLPPNINKGFYYFHVNKKKEIVYGLGSIKGVGKSSIDIIIGIRESGGIFKDIFDFCVRVNNRKITRRVFEKLIMSGSLDDLGSRAELMYSLEDTLRIAGQHIQMKNRKQIDMFGIFSQKSMFIKKINLYDNNFVKWTDRVLLEKERESLGVYLTRHPITFYLDEIKNYTDNLNLKDISSVLNKQIFTISGLVLHHKFITTKFGNRIGICIIDDQSDQLEVILKSDSLIESSKNLLKKGKILIVRGIVDCNEINYRKRILASNLMDIVDARERYLKRIDIFLEKKKINDVFLKFLYKKLKSLCFGKIPICFYYKNENAVVKINSEEFWRIVPSEEIINELQVLLGDQQIKFRF